MIAPTDFLYSNPVKLLPECPVPVFQTKTKRLRVYGSAEFTAVGCKATGFINFSRSCRSRSRNQIFALIF